MLITYFRSSSLGTWKMCQQQYFFQYSLGINPATWKATDKGTIVHKVLEILARSKKCKQEGIASFDDDVIGGPVKNEIKNEYIDLLTERVYEYYSNLCTHHKWAKADLRDCRDWVWNVINYKDGMFDPRKMQIFDIEKRFDIEIDKPWARYEFEYNGNKIEGNLGLKGTIDNITVSPDNPNCYEIVDWKTGQRKDWATGEIKDYALLKKDVQLRLYFYVLNKLLPDAESISVTIFFIKDTVIKDWRSSKKPEVYPGGPFTLCYGKKDLIEIEKILEEKFAEIKACEVPKLNITSNCTAFCRFGKESFDGTEHSPIVMPEDGHITAKGGLATKCEQVHYETKVYGLDYVTKKYRKPDYSPIHYKAPGTVE
jgi:PD-(D/E)XK nuclease superfamily